MGMSDRPELHDETLQIVQLTELWRALGADYARYGLHQPDDCPAPFFEGYDAERHGRGYVQPTKDVYVRKWCQVRANALRRQRAVQDSFNPKAIQTIDVAICPITRQPLTKGTGKGTDWSVDRLNNGLAYALGNVAIISKAANEAKSDRSFDEVVALSEATEPRHGLTPGEWSRLAALMYGPALIETGRALPIRQLVPVYPWVINTTFQELQELFLRIGMLRYDERRVIERRISNPILRTELAALGMLIANRIRHGEWAQDLWLDNELHGRVVEYVEHCERQHADLPRWVGQIYKAYEITDESHAALHADTNGFLFDHRLDLPVTRRRSRTMH